MENYNRPYLSKDAVLHVIHHVFLPPKLPSKDDSNPKFDNVLLKTVTGSLSTFMSHYAGSAEDVRVAVNMMQTMGQVHQPVGSTFAVDEGKLKTALHNLIQEGGQLSLYIAAQNSGLLASKVDERIVLEPFEISPRNEEVVSTIGRLGRSFPAFALSFHQGAIKDEEVVEAVSRAIAKMSHQRVPGTRPLVKKAREMHEEDRDTADPSMITEYLAAYFMAFETSRTDSVTTIRKNTREEVLYKSSLLPWRRSPLWLMIRVALQLNMKRTTGSSDLYKKFMVFFMAEVAERALDLSLPSDLLWSMNAKIARRCRKLGCTVDFARQAMRKINLALYGRWTDIQTESTPDLGLARIGDLDLALDTLDSNPALCQFLEHISDRDNMRLGSSFSPTSILPKYKPTSLPRIQCRDSLNAIALERWVAVHLEDWTESKLSAQSTCKLLGGLMRDYHVLVKDLLSENPEALSIMILTIMELWVACDRAACHSCPLLAEYDPAVPTKLLQNLVLPSRHLMGRLKDIEIYLQRRRELSHIGVPSLFVKFGSEDSFSVKWFRQSPEHQELLSNIEHDAALKKQRKLARLQELKNKYNHLMELHGASQCQYINIFNTFTEQHESQHSMDCDRCRYGHEAESLQIDIFEWPLPSNTLKAQSTVFELQVPPPFGHWRDTTLYMLYDVLGCQFETEKSPRCLYRPQGYNGLSRYYRPFSECQRCVLISENKPHEVTHRRTKKVSSATESNVCPANGLLSAYYDEDYGRFTGILCTTDRLRKLCTYTMPPRSSQLQRFLSRPPECPSGPPPNEVIASQSACPDHLSIAQYKALCSLPLGCELQWQNILVQLNAPHWDMQMPETTVAILQCIMQTGPSNGCGELRKGHSVVSEKRFCHALLDGLEVAVGRWEKNWQASQALSSSISLACRLASLNSDKDIRHRCLEFLAKCRETAVSWLQTLDSRATEVESAEQVSEARSRIVNIALVCFSSFDLDQGIAETVLANTQSATILLRCSILIQERQALAADPFGRMMYHRWQRTSFQTYKFIGRQITKHGNTCADNAVRQSWPAFQAAAAWTEVAETAGCWIATRAGNPGTDQTLEVHLNILNGELLVDGSPLGRLPKEYEDHETYRRLLGHSKIEVMPSAIPGFRFSSKSRYRGHVLHFGLTETGDQKDPVDLLVRASTDERHYEALPPRLLHGHFPWQFTEQYYHWYDLDEDSVEFRPPESVWAPSRGGWTLRRAGGEGCWRLESDGQAIVATRNPTAQILASVLHPLEDLPRMHCIVDLACQSLTIRLPALRLDFELTQGCNRIFCRQARGMFIDDDQSVGSLFGFENKLVLTNEDLRRVVIIPDGKVSHQKSEGHVRVSAAKDTATKAYIYDTDSLLCQLSGNGDAHAKLLLCYLHALTSFCLPDPLTERTGTEEALSILGSAAVASAELSEEAIGLLHKLALLSPRRQCYPAHERVMQTTDWDRQLSFLSQHGHFHSEVGRLLDNHSLMQTFTEEPYTKQPSLARMDSLLLQRDNNRSATFRVSGFGAEDFNIRHDREYRSRDRPQRSQRMERTHAMANLLVKGLNRPTHAVSRTLSSHLMQYLLRHEEVLGTTDVDATQLSYDGRWLQDSSEFIATSWLGIHHTLSRRRGNLNRHDLTLWLCVLSYADDADTSVLHTMASFITVPALAEMQLPKAPIFCLTDGKKSTAKKISARMQRELVDFHESPEASSPRRSGESKAKAKERRQRNFSLHRDAAVGDFAAALQEQWPCRVPRIPEGQQSASWARYIDVDAAMRLIEPSFRTWFRNREFSSYLDQVSSHVCLDTVPAASMPTVSVTEGQRPERGSRFVCCDDIFKGPPPPLATAGPEPDVGWLVQTKSKRHSNEQLGRLIERVSRSASCDYETQYAEALHSSLDSLTIQSWSENLAEQVQATLETFRGQCEQRFEGMHAELLDGVGARLAKHKGTIEQWPRLSRPFFLQQLTHRRWSRLNEGWRNYLVRYGLAVNTLQRAERMTALVDSPPKLVAELRNPGHTNWDPREFPESLLVEIENNITIREVQEEVAAEMRSPEAANRMLQLNMGEGKSSVIVPIVAAALADGSHLVRVVVPKPQARQMFAMLVSKLGGMLGRPVYRMPFSRGVKLGADGAQAVQRMFEACRDAGGVLLVQPEHILSFKLMALERIIAGDAEVGRALLGSKAFLDSHARDIVDESDEIFSPKFELVYTMGVQRPTDHSPDRWSRTHEVLGLLRSCISDQRGELPAGVESKPGPRGCFPRTRLLSAPARRWLLETLARRVCDNGLTGFPIAAQSEEIRRAVYGYISEEELSQAQVDEVEGLMREGPLEHSADTLHLLRGLIAGGVLGFVLQRKRWRVDYGLDGGRRPPTRLAVPYRGKDSPATRSEFSQPDVVIVKTSLCYYYKGLSDEELFLALGHLSSASDQAEEEYAAWVCDADALPACYRQITGVNLEDREQCVDELFPSLRHAKAAVDYFLAHVVFPKELREFPLKLSASGWDIGEQKRQPTTGFSGTNDARVLLPLDVGQRDMQSQVHTNALVLHHLLQPENDVAEMPDQDDGTSDAETLLAAITAMKPAVRVILDVGAQVLELDNAAVARRWLELLPADGTQGAVFFDDSDQLRVVDRSGHEEPLQVSPFATQLDLCVVFLDEAHTRGTDLKLPQCYRAAVTLGARLTKDRLVQACMRMRGLGRGQSVVFCVPGEIKTRIQRGVAGMSISDILEWAVGETWSDAHRSHGLWAAQGRRHGHQRGLWPTSCGVEPATMSEKQARGFLEEEARSLAETYKPRRADTPHTTDLPSDPISDRLRSFGDRHDGHYGLQGEQERELAPEKEKERQLQRPPPAEALPHQLHRDLQGFARTGVLPPDSDACMGAFQALSRTSAAGYLDVSRCPRQLSVSVDFAHCVREDVAGGGSFVSDSYQRPVQWILTGVDRPSRVSRAIIISPFEAQELQPIVRQSEQAALHVYSPRSNVGHRPLDTLDLFTVPERPEPEVPRAVRTVLNLFAGQLYFSSEEEYAAVLDAVMRRGTTSEPGTTQVPPDCQFGQDPIRFLRALYTRILRGADIDKTHMGSVLSHRSLQVGAFGEL